MIHYAQQFPQLAFGLHRVIYSTIDRNPGSRAKDITVMEPVATYITENNYSRATVGSYISAMHKCGLLFRRKNPNDGANIYRINPKRQFDERIIRALNSHYQSQKSTELFNAEAEWAKIAAEDNVKTKDVVHHLAMTINFYGAEMVCAAIPAAIEIAKNNSKG